MSPQANNTDWLIATTGEASAIFCRYRVLRGQHNGSLLPLILVFLTGAATISSKYLLS
jgi:hypothetical protein